MNNTKLMRLNKDLVEEIENYARKNQIKITEASRDIAKILKRRKFNLNY